MRSEEYEIWHRLSLYVRGAWKAKLQELWSRFHHWATISPYKPVLMLSSFVTKIVRRPQQKSYLLSE